MAYTPKILALAGSLREGSYNKKLVKIAAEGAEKKGASVTSIDLIAFTEWQILSHLICSIRWLKSTLPRFNLVDLLLVYFRHFSALVVTTRNKHSYIRAGKGKG